MTLLQPKVSISIVTYNHAKVIGQALDSALMQETNFPYEILVGEDDSSDGTREIVIEYAKKYPGRIRLFLNDRKNVIYINGKATGRWNLINNLTHARGQYIALLDGDDYWTSAHKLQKQVDFLEVHHDFSGCFHPVQRINERGDILNPDYGSRHGKDVYGFNDLVRGNFIPTCSIVFRSGIEKNLPIWFREIPVADWAIHLLNAQKGKIGYINDVMGVYRVHSGGVWMGISALERAKSDIQSLLLIGRHFSLTRKWIFRNTLSRRYFRLSRESRKHEKLANARYFAFQSFRFGSWERRKKAFRLLIELFLPGLLSFWRRYKKV